MINPRKTLFLLGGHDLEMLTIKRLLTFYGFMVLDKNLKWGACVSSYASIFDTPDPLLIYGIELKDDLGLSDPRYRPIDHHNNFSSLPSSLEQIATLIGHTLTRDEELIAANDRGYIPAMQDLGATQEQIDDIRIRDRRAQGVTEEDEALAKASIANNLNTTGSGTLIVNSLTSRFSAVCDCLYPFRRLLVYTDNEWVFYGDGKENLVAEMADDISAGLVYYGGGDFGYVGSAKGAFSPIEIKSFVERIKQRYERI